MKNLTSTVTIAGGELVLSSRSRNYISRAFTGLFFVVALTGWHVAQQLTEVSTTTEQVEIQQDQRNMQVVDSSSSSSPVEHYDVLVVVPGVGDASRISTTVKSLTTLSSSLRKEGYGFACYVYVWNPSILEEAHERLGSDSGRVRNDTEDSPPPPGCIIQLSRGMWTHHMSRVPDLSSTSTTHVAVLMDDVNATGVDMADFLRIMTWTGFGVASPGFVDRAYSFMRARDNCIFHRTDFVDILLAVFQRNIWDCFQQNIDPERNAMGWGMDVVMHQLCNTTMGVIDTHSGVHPFGRTYDAATAERQMFDYITRKVPGITNVSEARGYLVCASQHRPRAFDECEVYRNESSMIYALNGSTTQRRMSKTVDWSCSKHN